MEVSQEALQARVDATANEVRSFARGYANAVEAHCLSLLHRLEELRVQRRYGQPTQLLWKRPSDVIKSVRALDVSRDQY